MVLRSDLVLQKVGDETLVLDLKTNQIHQFNATAAWILERINGPETMESLATKLAEIYSVDRDAAFCDINMFVRTLRELTLLDEIG
jgi:hypothetical protein